MGVCLQALARHPQFLDVVAYDCYYRLDLATLPWVVAIAVVTTKDEPRTAKVTDCDDALFTPLAGKHRRITAQRNRFA
jgi:hypothetical protein